MLTDWSGSLLLKKLHVHNPKSLVSMVQLRSSHHVVRYFQAVSYEHCFIVSTARGFALEIASIMKCLLKITECADDTCKCNFCTFLLLPSFFFSFHFTPISYLSFWSNGTIHIADDRCHQGNQINSSQTIWNHGQSILAACIINMFYTSGLTGSHNGIILYQSLPLDVLPLQYPGNEQTYKTSISQ